MSRAMSGRASGTNAAGAGVVARMRPRRVLFVAVVAVAGALSATAADAGSRASWSMSGQGITNWRYQPDEHKLTQGNVKSQLGVKWVATLAGDISATPAVVDDVVYVPDWGGKFSALDATTGAVIWQDDVATLTGVAGAKSRTSPAVSGNLVVFGTQKGGRLVAVDKNTGEPRWVTQLDSHELAIVTQSPTIYNGRVYVGVASTEENGVDCDASLNACHFRGSVSAVDLATGQRHLEDLHHQPGTAAGRILGRSRLGVVACHRRQAALGLHHHGQQLLGAPEREGLRDCCGHGPRGARRVRATGQRQLRRRDHVARLEHRGDQMGEQDAGL